MLQNALGGGASCVRRYTRWFSSNWLAMSVFRFMMLFGDSGVSGERGSLVSTIRRQMSRGRGRLGESAVSSSINLRITFVSISLFFAGVDMASMWWYWGGRGWCCCRGGEVAAGNTD